MLNRMRGFWTGLRGAAGSALRVVPPNASSWHRLAIATLLLPAVFLSAPIAADEPAAVNLLRPDSLVGWNHSATAPRGWTVAGGVLRGTGQSTPLLSGWTLGDFELSLDWTVRVGGKLLVAFPDVPSGKGIQIAFAEGDTAALVARGKEVEAGASPITAKPNGPHSTVIRRAGKQLTVTIDGRQQYIGTVAADQRFGLAISVAAGSASASNLQLREPAGEPIFNGQDLSGWWCPGNKKAWAAVDGEIRLVARGGNYLRTEKEYGNYTFSCEFKTPPGTNSGLGIRTPRTAWPSGDGMELQIYNGPGLGSGSMMALYRNVPPLAVNHRRDDWNRLVVKADGRMVTAWMNGQIVQHVNTAWEPELKHRNLSGWIGFQDHGKTIQIRDLRVHEAPGGLGLDAWYAPRPRPAGRVVLDRLMNTERLSRQDGIGSAHVVKNIAADAGETVVAQLAGPGALVRVDAQATAGRVALYFDGEAKPRIECAADQLAGQLPKLSRRGRPLLTYVAYQKSLRVVHRGGGPARYDLACVRLPRELVVASYARGSDGIPAADKAAIDYRLAHHRFGTVRQQDPYHRVSATGKTIEPGRHVEVISADGAGLVQWFQLHGPAALLAGNDLWIELHVDGRPQPSLAAPARYLFAGQAVGGNYDNFLTTNRGGPTNRLAIPFGNGLKLRLVNRGNSPIKGVGMTASIQRAEKSEGEDFARRMRLRGVFVPAAGGGDRQPVRLAGAGRWIGIVAEDRDSPRQALAGITLDGQPAAAWSKLSLDDLVGKSPGETDFRTALSGRQGGLAWRYLLLAPLEFQRSFEMKPAAGKPGARLLLFYSSAR